MSDLPVSGQDPEPTVPEPTRPEPSLLGVSDTPPAPAGAPRRGLRSIVAAGIAGGLVGAVAAAGIYAAFDDDTNTTNASSSTTPAPTADSQPR